MTQKQTRAKKSTKTSHTQITSTKEAEQLTEARKVKLVGTLYRPLCKILVLIGIATILLATITIWQYRSATKRTNQTTAAITKVSRVSGVGHDESGAESQKCQISYQFNIDGHDFNDSMGYRGDPTTDKCQLKPGDVITIKYDNDRPANNAYIVDEANSDHNTASEAIASAVSIGLVGLVPLVTGLVGIKLENNGRISSDPHKVKAGKHIKHTTKD